MKKYDDLYGFPVKKNEVEGIIEIDSNCNYPSQSIECKDLFQGIERLFINEEKLKYPLNINESKVVLKPTKENIENYFSIEGIKRYLEEIKSRLIGTITFYKPEVHFGKNKLLPSLILHFYQVNYNGKLNINNSYEFSNKCFINYNDKEQLSPDRVSNLDNHKINSEWIRHIPLYPIELIKFDSQNNIISFRHQELNNPATK